MVVEPKILIGPPKIGMMPLKIGIGPPIKDFGLPQRGECLLKLDKSLSETSTYRLTQKRYSTT